MAKPRMDLPAFVGKLLEERAVSTTLRQPDTAFTVATPCWRRA